MTTARSTAPPQAPIYTQPPQPAYASAPVPIAVQCTYCGAPQQSSAAPSSTCCRVAAWRANMAAAAATLPSPPGHTDYMAPPFFAPQPTEDPAVKAYRDMKISMFAKYQR